MTKFRYKATGLIADTFREHDVKFDVKNILDSEQVCAGFSVNCGPSIIVCFISHDDDNDVAVRVMGLITNTPGEKRDRLIEACNILNHEFRHIKFVVDRDGDINVEYDFPIHTPDEGVGEMALETLVRMMHILDDKYSIFMKALYTEERLENKEKWDSDEMKRRLAEFRAFLEAEKNDADCTDDDFFEIGDEADGFPDDPA